MSRTIAERAARTGSGREPARQRNARNVLWLLPVMLAGLFLGLFLGGGAWDGPAPGADDPGTLVGWGLPIARLIAVVGGVLAIGWLASATFLAPQGRKGVLSRIGRADVSRAAWAAAAWSVASLATLAFNHAMTVGKPVWQALNPDLFWRFAFAVDVNVAFAVSAVVAAAVAIGAVFVSRTGPALALFGLGLLGVAAPGLAGHSSNLGDHALAMLAGLVHSVGTALWVGSLVAVAVHVLRDDPGLRRMLPRYGKLSIGALIALGLSGAAAAYTRLEQPADLFTSGYGYLVVAKTIVLLMLMFVAVDARRSLAAGGRSVAGRRSVWRWLLAEGSVLGIGVGLAVAMTRTPDTRIEVPLGSPAEELLGFPFPPPPDVTNVILGWRPDPIFIAISVAMAVLYALGVRAIHRRGRTWPIGRSIGWFLGVAVLFWSTNAGIAAYAQVSVGWHMLQHMTLAMLAPVLLVLGAPATLALRALRPSKSGDRGPREWVLWALHSPVSKVVTHPAYVLAISTFGLFGLYFTELFPLLMSTHLGHVVMQLHFLLSGFLFYWVVVGVDPAPREVPYWAKLLLLLVYLALHGFFAIGLMMMQQPLGESWYGLVQPPWLTDLVRDTYFGGGIAWGFGEIPTLIVMIAVGIQWARSDERLARRLDRAADRDGDAELKAYNERLAGLARQDARQARSAAARDLSS